MKFSAFILLIFLFSLQNIHSQNQKVIDSMVSVYNSLPDNYEKVMTSARLYYAEVYTNPQKGEKHARNSIRISQKIDYTSGVTVGHFHIGVYFYLVRDLDSAKFYYNKTLDLAQTSQDRVMISKAYSELAQIAQDEGSFEKALQLRNFGNQEFKEANDYLNYGIGIGSKAMIYNDKGDFKKAVEQSLLALRILDTIDREPYRKADINSQIGNIEARRNNIHQAIKYYNNALNIYIETNDNIYISNTYIKIGESYQSLKNYKEAKKNISLGLDIAKKYNIKDNIMNALSGLGEIYAEEKKYEKAVEYLNKSLEMSTENDFLNHISILNTMGYVLTQKGEEKKALQYLQTSIRKADSLGAIYQLKNAFQQRAATFESLKEYQKALSDTKEFNRIADSLDNVTKSKQIEELKITYETEKKEAAIALQKEEIKNLSQQVEISNLRKTLYAGGMISFIAVSGLLFFGFKQRIKKNKIEREKQEAIYKQEIEFKKKELTSQTLHLVQKNSFIQELKENLERIKNSPELFKVEFRRLVLLLKKESAEDKDWEVFKSYFADVHNNFDNKLKSIYAEISEKEIRLASFLRMNLTTKEIATMLNVLPDSVLKSKYRLKKKLNLDKEIDLYQFLNTL
ncbi:Tetratricopeptide repeat-containing protein [Aquimarina amphilecti]|uniref:Tetratricopeptide repeat-containing protein n=1 Tax=Aquimarina amphilecti TaxID=1038014 RepID=A0A1H7RMJ0_AQUAM|nr:tetratricopeptide repeat protein [Aquimarina amphilecti]SEL61248.1 Tetratricopeptide repeat-containing protein [Aquimarina amphilecti]